MAIFQWLVLIIIVFGLIKDTMDLVDTGNSKYSIGKADGTAVIAIFSVRVTQFFILFFAGAFDKIF